MIRSIDFFFWKANVASMRFNMIVMPLVWSFANFLENYYRLSVWFTAVALFTRLFWFHGWTEEKTETGKETLKTSPIYGIIKVNIKTYFLKMQHLFILLKFELFVADWWSLWFLYQLCHKKKRRRRLNLQSRLEWIR